MRRQMVKNNTRKNRRDNQIKVTVHWQHTEEVTPDFKRLVILLLKTRAEKDGKPTT